MRRGFVRGLPRKRARLSAQLLPTFIHAGGLHGDAKSLTLPPLAAATACAALMSGMTCTRSYVRLWSKCARSKSSVTLAYE